MRYDKLLKSHKKAIGVWGTGYIGFSTMAFFAKNNIIAIGYDTSLERIKVINRGGYVLKELKDWLRFPVKPLVKKGLLRATSNYMDFAKRDVIAHFIAIPTEKGGEPHFDILEDVIKKISLLLTKKRSAVKPIVIVESTLSPRTSDARVIPLFEKCGIKIGRNLLYGVAPRRDWFVEGGKNLKDLDRVYGGYNTESSTAIGKVLGLVCKKLHKASSCYVSEMVKSFENVYRHVEITLANQISLAYPTQNIREALELAGTKWNIGTFRPGFGTGGYCIPLSSKYVIEGAEKEKELTIPKETIRTDREINILIAKSLIKRGLKQIGVLGLSYKGNLKVSILSPTIPFVKALKRGGVKVKIFDPYFSKEEIRKILRIPTFSFPQGMRDFDGIVVAVDHKEYMLPPKKLLKNLDGCRFILDNTGMWSGAKPEFKANNIEYHLAGDENWL